MTDYAVVTSTSNTLNVGKYPFGSGGYANMTVGILLLSAFKQSQDWIKILHNAVNDNISTLEYVQASLGSATSFNIAIPAQEEPLFQFPV